MICAILRRCLRVVTMYERPAFAFVVLSGRWIALSVEELLVPVPDLGLALPLPGALCRCLLWCRGRPRLAPTPGRGSLVPTCCCSGGGVGGGAAGLRLIGQ